MSCIKTVNMSFVFLSQGFLAMMYTKRGIGRLGFHWLFTPFHVCDDFNVLMSFSHHTTMSPCC